MNKVYILLRYNMDYEEIHGVYTNRKYAEAYINDWVKDTEEDRENFRIQEAEINKAYNTEGSEKFKEK